MAYKKNIQSLEKFIQNVYWGNALSEKDAIKNLEDGLMEIKYTNNYHSSNALLITNNGYVLTSNHCTNNYKNLVLTNFKNNNYKIERVCQYNKNKDIALIKINQNMSNDPIIYKIKNIHKLLDAYPLGYLVEHKSRWSGEIKNKFGKITKTKQKSFTKNKSKIEKIDDQISVNIPIIPGDSGGIMLDYTGGLIGFATSTNGIESGYSTIFAGIDLIQKEINFLKNPIKRNLRKIF